MRFDKEGQRIPDTGRGCGCQQCADANAPRYERRSAAMTRTGGRWSAVRRLVVTALRRPTPAA
jgi:hypothetical protein